MYWAECSRVCWPTVDAWEPLEKPKKKKGENPHAPSRSVRMAALREALHFLLRRGRDKPTIEGRKARHGGSCGLPHPHSPSSLVHACSALDHPFLPTPDHREIAALPPLALPSRHSIAVTRFSSSPGLMSDRNQSQTQTQTQTHIEPPPQPQPIHDPASSSSAAATALEIINPLPPPQSASPPSKIPLRPQKIRKLSPGSSTPDPKPSAASASTKSKAINASSSSKPSKNRIVSSRALALPRVIARSLSCDGEVEAAIRHLRDADPLLAPLIDVHPPPTFDIFLTPFLALTKSILYQQLAYKAGTSIYTRFTALCGGEAGVLPETVLALDPHQLRQIGVSARKASYLHDLARKYQNGILSDSAIVNMDDKSLFTMLTMVNGIGSWSVHMFMIFSLHRPDVLPINDLGVRKGVQLLYGLEELPRPSQMEVMCDKWRPYRSVASWYMWRFVESKGAPSSAAAVAAGASLQQQHQEVEEQQQHHPQQPQLLDPINSILNLGYNPFHFSS